jgi:hypothetical protein
MTAVCWEMSGSVRNYDSIVVLESMIVQYWASGVCQSRVPSLMLGIRVASKYKVPFVLGQCREILGLEVVRWAGRTQRQL